MKNKATYASLVTSYCAAAILAVTPVIVTAGVVTAGMSPLTQAAIYYKNEVIAVWSIIACLLGAALSAVWRPPADIPVDMSLNSAWTKFMLGMGGGMGSFFYLTDMENELAVTHIVWALGASFVTPVAVQIAYPVVIELGLKLLKVWSHIKGQEK